MQNNTEAPTTYHILGLMSGSSLDGLDVVYCRMEGRGDWIGWEIIAAETLPYTEPMSTRLRDWADCSATELLHLEADYSLVLCDMLKPWIAQHCPDLDLIVSHGHTLYHAPQASLSTQIGNGGILAARLGYPVLCDLRIQDIALGGQGAPLAALIDHLLFAQYGLALNIGGIANLSYSVDDVPHACDLCAANQVLNHLASREGLAYDDGGRLAAQGQIIPEWLTKLHAIPYHSQPAPKSLDNGWVFQNIIQTIPEGKTEDLLATYCRFMAQTIASFVAQNALDGQHLLSSGGGAFNAFLIQELEAALSAHQVQVHVASDELVAYKEGLLMALMGFRYLQQESNTLASATGASQDLVAGAFYYGTNTNA